MRSRVFAALVACAFIASSAHACTIPVFRYALDRWPADRYRLEVSAADAKDEAVAHFRRNFTDSTPLNLALASPPAGSADSSRLFFPHAAPGVAPAWSGALEAKALGTLTGSPARKEIVRRILAGDSCVWVLVESGKTDADNAAAAALTKRLRYLGQILQIPPIDPDDPSSQLGPGPPLAAKFSMLRVRSGDAAEQPFLAMLAGPKGAAALRDGPWFATVFGRGRVLGAWPAADFGDEQIDEICMFLLGACSCQVKRENPGWDLLLDADWDGALQAMGLPATDAPTPVSNTLEAAASAPALETVTITPAAPAAVPAADAVWPNFTSPRVVAPMMLLVLGAGLGWWIVRNQS